LRIQSAEFLPTPAGFEEGPNGMPPEFISFSIAIGLPPGLEELMVGIADNTLKIAGFKFFDEGRKSLDS